MNVLVLAAHPDDEVLGCGGTIARLSSEGHKVSIAILGQGVASRFSEETAEVTHNDVTGPGSIAERAQGS